jgi:hypothetical protein
MPLGAGRSADVPSVARGRLHVPLRLKSVPRPRYADIMTFIGLCPGCPCGGRATAQGTPQPDHGERLLATAVRVAWLTQLAGGFERPPTTRPMLPRNAV